ncbi:MAG: hypothetical protein ACE5GA_05380, partial [Candidatus Zixiibacteriota bacterium]
MRQKARKRIITSFAGARLALVVAFCACLMPHATRAQISPGELASVHESLEGILNCTNCHKLGKGPSAEKCLNCHKEVASLLESGRGLHNLAVNEEGQLCFNCHSDHGGRDLDIIHWPNGQENFDHGLTGFTLEGKHRQAACKQCHKAEFVRGKFLSEFPDLNLARTFLGLDDNCLSCHHDEHRQQLGSDCNACHTADGWKPAKNFSHSSAKFKLVGKHQDVTCEKCHAPRTRPVVRAPGGTNDVSFVKYTGIEHGDCNACHSDPHSGRFKGTCKSCHNSTEWMDVRPGSFDHTQTKFALKGLHNKTA